MHIERISPKNPLTQSALTDTLLKYSTNFDGSLDGYRFIRGIFQLFLFDIKTKINLFIVRTSDIQKYK